MSIKMRVAVLFVVSYFSGSKMGGSDNDIIFVSALGKIQARRNNFELSLCTGSNLPPALIGIGGTIYQKLLGTNAHCPHMFCRAFNPMGITKVCWVTIEIQIRDSALWQVFNSHALVKVRSDLLSYLMY